MLSPVVFEPNSASTRQSVIAAINNYLYKLWKQGGLYGTTPDSAFRVELALEGDGIANGILRVRVSLSALRPQEFIYLEFTQDMPAVA
ncbi:Phage tail sheath protein FI [Serratia rubidaea]|uniref:phage tail sheath C-terminal domain-containing protein n=1 Tax=Serratia rubidaea TaxID=61652 RepID=UPI00078AFFEF|nr:phage tail sheath C-terminal domain-containing protein [Serratia rubidaea]AML59572.1 Phage tail sheath protein FI [Serratia rubidaea]